MFIPQRTMRRAGAEETRQTQDAEPPRTFSRRLGAVCAVSTAVCLTFTLATPGVEANAATSKAPSANREAAESKDRPRIIVTTDGEGDDIASMHRLLLYANDLDIVGIVSSSSMHHWAGDPTATPPIATRSWHGTEWIPELINEQYRQVHPNLVQHDATYPSADELLSVVRTGNITNNGEMATDTPGSELIKETLLDDNPGVVNLQAWGGTNTIAAALRSIEAEYKGTSEWAAISKRVSDKASLYLIQDQDVTYKEYIAKNWPDVQVIVNRDQFEAFAYGYFDYNPPATRALFQKDWITEHLLQGPFMADYPTYLNGDSTLFHLCRGAVKPGLCQPGDWTSEGDSPAFLHAIRTGLRQDENASWGGWGGRFVQLDERLWADLPSYLGDSRPRATDRSNEVLWSTQLIEAAPAGATSLQVFRDRVHSSSGRGFSEPEFVVGDKIVVGAGETAEIRHVTQVVTGGYRQPATVQIDSPLTKTHAVNETVGNYNGTHWTQSRWNDDIQRDFAARVQWTMTSGKDANHEPVVSVPEGKLDITAKPGQRVQLVAQASDPDGDALSARWWQYAEAGTYAGQVSVTDPTALRGPGANVKVPQDAKSGETIHLILEVTDDGEMPLTRYQRVIITVK